MTVTHDERFSIRSGWRRGCRCSACHRELCRAAKVNWALKTIWRGDTPQWRVRTELAGRHVLELLEAGWTFDRIAKAAGVAPSSVHRLLHARRCSNLVSGAVLAVES